MPKLPGMPLAPVTYRVRRYEEAKERREKALREQKEELQKAEAGDLPARFKGSFEYFAESCLHLGHIDGGVLVPLQLTDGQRVVAQEIDKSIAHGEAVRLCVLKSRRSLISSLCEAAGYWYTSTRPYAQGIILAHKQEVTEEIFNIVDGFYLHDERKLLGLRPPKEASSRRELWFGNPDKRSRDMQPGLQSGLLVTSAEAKEPGRAGTYHFVHGSEVAYWPEATPVWQAVGIALSRAPGTLAILETTANGQSGLFHETYRRARQGPGASWNAQRCQNEWLAIFLGWWEDRRNRVPELTPEKLSAFDYVSKWERDYAERWKLDPEQVLWRRMMLADPVCFKPGVKPEDVFRQEYPADDDEAFLATGRHFFLLPKVKELEEDPVRGVKEPKQTGRMVNDGPSLEDRSPANRFRVVPKLVEEREGTLRMWAGPRKGTPYLVVVDPAEGLQQGDQSVIGVLDRARLDWVAFLACNDRSARELAWDACLLGWWYETALLVIEHNNHGIATIEESRRIMYPKLWHDMDVTRPGSEPSERVGWRTTGAMRQYALGNLEAELRGPHLGLHAQEFFDQARVFVWPDTKQGGRTASTQAPGPRARVGHKDDFIMVTSIGLAVHMNAGIPRVDVPLLLSTSAKQAQEQPAPLVPANPRPTVKQAFTRRKIHNRNGYRY